MKTYTYKITNNISKSLFLKEYDEILESRSVLIQLFSGEDITKIQNILTFLKKNFPNAKIVASSTDGEIFENEVLTKESIVSISLFRSTELISSYVNMSNSFEMGVALAKKIVTPRTKLLIAFADGLFCNGEEFLNGIHSVAPELVVAGGLSADNGEFVKCYLGMDEELFESGAVGVALDSDHLNVKSLYSFGWDSIGLQHKVTKAIKNRVYTIDDLTAVAFYEKYLGSSISESLPKTGIEFPLILSRNGTRIARAALVRHEDESLSFAGNVAEGSLIHIGVGDVSTILNKYSLNKDIAVETFFIYSCMARRHYMPELIHKEIEPFAKISPTSGFFTYGEFYTGYKPELLNQTLTAVAISESNDLFVLKKEEDASSSVSDNTTYSALMNIINTTAKELQLQTKKQENIEKELLAKTKTLSMIQEIASLGSWELNLETLKIKWSPESYKIYGIDLNTEPPTYQKFMKMVLPEDRNKFEEIQESLVDNRAKSIEVRIKRADGKILNIVESGKLVFENGKATKIVGTTLDITELRLQDRLLMQQTKLAQMGEMINMIAHQWRQPLNAISSAAIKLNIQSEMELATKEEISSTTDFIEEMSQTMSQTIDDFMNFTKPIRKEESVQLEQVVRDVLKIIESQLINHEISISIVVNSNFPVVIYRKELEHVLLNLITNARDAFNGLEKEGKYIIIKINSEEKKHFLEVSDNAGGIDEAIIDRVFEPYFTTKDLKKGTGLGLYMSKKIVEEHLRGCIKVRNENDGALFTLRLRDCYE